MAYLHTAQPTASVLGVGHAGGSRGSERSLSSWALRDAICTEVKSLRSLVEDLGCDPGSKTP